MLSETASSELSPASRYWAIYIFPAAALFGMAVGGVWTLLTVALAFIGVVLADAIVGLDTQNPQPGEEDSRRVLPQFDWPLLAWLPLQTCTLLAALVVITSEWLSPWEAVGLTISIAVLAGAGGITIAHELVHRKEAVPRHMGWGLMISVLYGHWALEHVRGHHMRVATREDPATSRYGETVYAFVGRSIVGGFVSAWGLEAHRLRRRDQSAWSWKNRVVQGLVYQGVLLGGVTLLFGPVGLAFWIGQAIVGVCLLEAVNYLEHYGLERRKIEGGYERVRPIHSWNASHRVTNWVLFALGRHSDHHAAAGREYPILRHMEEAPQLPAGYPAMILLALVPPLWFRVMNPRVEAWRAQHLSRLLKLRP